MKKRWLSLLMSLVLAAGLCVPAFAEEMDSELTRVTLAVKNTLSIPDSYADFQGTLSDMGALRYWQLNWTNGDGGASLSVTATDQGKVMSYSLSTPAADVRPAGGYSPRLAKTTQAAARAAAETFLKKVLTAGETYALSRSDSGAMPVSIRDGSCGYQAQILVNGIPAPYTASIQVDADTGAVTNFQRSDLNEAYVNAVPSAQAKVTAQTAAAAFAAKTTLELQYVANDDGTKAELRYVPALPADSYVDAQTGALVSLADAWSNLVSGTGGEKNTTAASAAQDTAASLSDAEQKAVTQLKGVLSKEALDAAARKVTALGLGRYTLSNAWYQAEEDGQTVTAMLTYYRPLTAAERRELSADANSGELRQYRTLTMDAKTAALLEGASYRPWYVSGSETKTTAAAKTAADSFLAYQYPAYAAKVALTASADNDFVYTRKENGYPYYANDVDITVDPSDNAVVGFTSSWDEKITFQSAEGLISADRAKTVLTSAYAAKLQYLGYPVAVDTGIPVWKTYAECCGSVAYRYVLGYTYETEGGAVTAVDAKTGRLIRVEQDSAAAEYTDIAGSYAKEQIAAIAAVGAVFGASDQFKPAAALTERDMLVLLLNSCGYSFDVEELADQEQLDDLYAAARQEGFYTGTKPAPAQAVTRMGFLRAVIGASPYGAAAELKGIYKVSYRDAAGIAAGDLGYAAIAQVLGIARGTNGRLNPQGALTRQTAAVMLYNYMNR